jgi:uncharacterized membrane protein YdjX (TVP38/TMEM64 family)
VLPRVALVLAVLALPFVLAQLAPVRNAVIAAVELMRTGGVVGAVVYFGAYTVGILLTAPIWIFNGMAGYAYGPVRGIFAASAANLTAATTAFLVGRFLLTAPITRWLAKNERWSLVRRAVEAESFRIGFLLRLSPLAPQNLMSYGFSLTPMPLGTFMAVTWLGLLPVICFQVYVGSLLHDIADLIDGKRPPLGPWGWVATGGAVAITVFVVVAVARLGQRAIARHAVVAASAEE